MTRKRKLIYLITVIFITVFFLVLGFTFFYKSYFRLIESLRDLWFEIAYYIELFTGLKLYKGSTVLDPSKFFSCNFLPRIFNQFIFKFKRYFSLLFSFSTFKGYLYLLFKIFLFFCKYGLYILPFLFSLIILIKKISNRPNNNYNKDTLPLIIYRRIEKLLILKPLAFIKDFLSYLRENGFILKIWLVLWLFNLNVISILISFFAYYIYFVSTLDMGSLYFQFYKLFADLSYFFKPYVFIFILPFILKEFNKSRRNTALSKLRHYEAKNCGLINLFGIVAFITGSMGKRKTTIITDMVLSQEVMFRQKALKIMLDNDLKFPNFPWILLEKDLQKQISKGKITNLVGCKNFIEEKKKKFLRRRNYKTCLYGYDKVYPLYYYNGLYDQDIFEVLSVYSQAYFIYIISTALILSNYSIRSSNELFSYGNLPIWNYDFFSDSGESRFSHILDFDIVRLGKKVLADSNSLFEFGVVSITEVGKERGNNLELQGIKKNSEETNQKNDLFNQWLKMCRHSSTVDFFPFVKVFADEQRPESWGADAKDLADILVIKDSSDLKITLPFYIYEEIIIDFVLDKFYDFYLDYRYKRGDNSLICYLFKKLAYMFFKRKNYVVNNYGYRYSNLLLRNGPNDNDTSTHKYYLCSKKIYNKRFSSDCFNDYFSDKIKDNVKDLISTPTYSSDKASVEELKQQNSYFIRSLYGIDD